MVVPLLRRTAVLIVSVVIASIVVFAFMAVLPGNPAEVALGTNATPQAVKQLEQEFGTDRPVVTQYADWAGGLPTGDFGVSYTTRDAIGPQISDRIQGTRIRLAAAGTVALLIAVPFVAPAAAPHRRPSGVAVSAASQVGAAIPAFI